MKTRKYIFDSILLIIAIAVPTSLGLTSQAMSAEQKPEKILFLQDIQSQLIRVSGVKDRNIPILVSRDQKRKITLTPSSVTLSYGFMKQMNTINQLVATMAHMMAHISLDFVATPPLPEEDRDHTEKTSVEDYIKDTVLQKYPDRGYIPQATGAFHDKNTGMTIIERPGYQNKEYDYSVNKAAILHAEHEREVDKITDKILRHSGFCPSDYSRMLHYFYETPQQLLGNKHFALDADQWPRIDTADSRSDPATSCDDSQIAQIQKYAPAFDQLKVNIMQSLRKKD